ncbi:MAG TPA: FtsH protease activity modulator HflK [Fervidobacterium sp.]|jgi:membrane protease subunit HflK|nr:FtsH protease activity modulator HflK [Fervidobacterium sp.]NLH37070.1 FtsH protease activity modulator HflK [Thermotogaceae bacterium]HCL98820.1 FtsH protease activity modulator HflK [Fervidobacterium sp.]HOA16505.1 FtsH protease activity modulator HflK [Fervidobacterium sp.]HOH53037.1 FtsH protease activity modulator HflK [Fervidobacterium sp.]
MRRWFIPIIVLIVLLVIYIGTGVFQVNPSEMALIKTFGKFKSMVGPGIHIHAPIPFQSHVIVDIQSIRKEEIGFRTVGDQKYETKDTEALMLTVDGNIVSVEAVVSYTVSDPVKYAFRLRDPSNLVRFSTESALRDRISKRTVDEILTGERENVADEVLAIVQNLLNTYDAGIKLVNVLLQEVVPPSEVVSAFDDVNNAKQDKERYINEATKYANNLVPKVEGQALKIQLEAESYSQQQVLKATGETQRYLALLEEYRKAPQITETRLKISTLQEVLPKAKRVMMLDNSQKLSLISLDEILGGDGK